MNGGGAGGAALAGLAASRPDLGLALAAAAAAAVTAALTRGAREPATAGAAVTATSVRR